MPYSGANSGAYACTQAPGAPLGMRRGLVRGLRRRAGRVSALCKPSAVRSNAMPGFWVCTVWRPALVDSTVLSMRCSRVLVLLFGKSSACLAAGWVACHLLERACKHTAVCLRNGHVKVHPSSTLFNT